MVKIINYLMVCLSITYFSKKILATCIPYEKPIRHTYVHHLKRIFDHNDNNQYHHLEKPLFSFENSYYLDNHISDLHGQVTSIFENNKTVMCSGIMVGPYHVLTSGYAVYNHENLDSNLQTWPQDVVFTLYMSEKLFSAKVIAVLSTSNWIEKKHYNMGMLILDQPLGQEIGWYSLPDQPISIFPKYETTILGCNDKTNAIQSKTSIITKVEKEFFKHTIDCKSEEIGQSIWYQNNLIGITDYEAFEGFTINGKADNGRRAVRLSHQKLTYLRKWIERKYDKQDHEEIERFFNARQSYKNKLYDKLTLLTLINCYYNGIGVEKNIQKTSKFLSKVFIEKNFLEQLSKDERGHVFFLKGQVYHDGKSDSDMSIIALNYFTEAAQLGHLEAQLKLAHKYLKDNLAKKSFKYFKLAAEQ